MNQTSYNNSEASNIEQDNIIEQQIEQIKTNQVDNNLNNPNTNDKDDKLTKWEYQHFDLGESCQGLYVNHSYTWISACYRCCIELYRLTNNQWAHCQNINARHLKLCELKFSPDSTYLAYNFTPGLHIWKLQDVEITNDNNWTWVQHLNKEGWIHDFTFNHNSTLLAYFIKDSICIYQLTNEMWTCKQVLQFVNQTFHLCFNHNSTILGISQLFKCLQLYQYDIHSQSFIMTYELPQQNMKLFSFNYNSLQIITAGLSETITVWQLSESNVWKQLSTISLTFNESQIQTLLIHPRQHVIASKRIDNTIGIWRIGSNGRWKRIKYIQCQGDSSALFFTPSGSNLLAVIDNRKIIMLL